jgi:hypothetical protein
VQPLFTFDDLRDPTRLATSVQRPDSASRQALFAQLSPATQQQLASWDGALPLPSAIRTALLNDLSGSLQTWTPQPDLLESGPSALDFVAEIDNDGLAHLRFGDGVCGYRPDSGTLFRADYRLGNGKAGNVGCETSCFATKRSVA